MLFGERCKQGFFLRLGAVAFEEAAPAVVGGYFFEFATGGVIRPLNGVAVQREYSGHRQVEVVVGIGEVSRSSLVAVGGHIAVGVVAVGCARVRLMAQKTLIAVSGFRYTGHPVVSIGGRGGITQRQVVDDAEGGGSADHTLAAYGSQVAVAVVEKEKPASTTTPYYYVLSKDIP